MNQTKAKANRRSGRIAARWRPLMCAAAVAAMVTVVLAQPARRPADGTVLRGAGDQVFVNGPPEAVASLKTDVISSQYQAPAAAAAGQNDLLARVSVDVKALRQADPDRLKQLEQASQNLPPAANPN